MSTREVQALARSNDPLLEALLHAGSESAREREIERLVVAVTQPLAARIVSRYTRSAGGIDPADAEDIIATVSVRVVRKLRAITETEEEAVRQFTDYVARLTYNTINDHLRARHPQRTRLSNRLRYVLTHDPRLALWTSPAGLTAGAASSKHVAGALAALTLERADAPAVMLDARRPADALVEIFRRTAGPVLFSALVDSLAALWQIEEPSPARTPVPIHEAEHARFETRDFLHALWREVQSLPARQRKALLLNLRDTETINVISLFIFTRTATFDEIAAVMEMSTSELAAIWNDLPLDDRRIGELLHIERQQVINLRKAARKRLGRRLFRRNP